MTETVSIPERVREAYDLGDAAAEPVSIGWINRTFVVAASQKVVLQRLHPIFSGEVNRDIDAITRHLEERGVSTPRVVPTRDGALFVEADGVWRALTFLEGRTVDALDDPALARSAAALVARFHRALADLDHTFAFTRPGAHDTPAHLAKLRAAAEASPDHPRAGELAKVANAILEAARTLPAIGALPTRIIHGDLKATNVLFAHDTPTALALVDLDTLAHGTLAVELGDALRSWCNVTSESDPDATFSPSIFEAAMLGYSEGARGFFQPSEVEAIVPGALTIALELASRFATDAYEDRYFGWDASRFESRVDHNLARARSQLSLARSIEAQRVELESLVRAAFPRGAKRTRLHAMAIPSSHVLTIDEVTIEEREELHREGARIAGLATFRAEIGERSVYSNELMALFGVGDGEPVDTARLIEALHPEDRPRAQRALETVLREGRIPPIDVRIVRPDGTVRYVRGMGERVVRDDGKVVLFGVIRDITAQREAELAATLHLYSLEEAQRIAGVGSFVVTLRDEQIRWTTGMYRITGIEPGSTLTPEVASQAIHPDDAARNVAWFRQIAAGEPGEPILVRSIRPNGEMRWTETHAAKVRFEDGIDRVVGTTIDLTDRVALEDRLRHAAKMEAIGTLAAGLAHDFNNYLTVIATNVELAAKQSAGSEPLADVTHAVQQCATLTRQLLAFARRQPAQARVVDLGAIVRRAARLLARLLDERIGLSVEVPSEPVPVEADPAHLEQVVLNLATNARDAVGDSGTITLRVRRGESPAGPEAILEVADDGAGIDPAHLPNIFDPYFTTKSAGEGTGLGLASVYGTVRQNRGTVSVHSARGEGTTFEVSFPLASGATIEDPGSASVASRSHHGTVLVVEDMADVRRVLARALRGAGYETLEASDGVAALGILDERLAAGTRLDAIVSDVVMPRMDGPALAREVQVRAPGTPVVFVTGYADQPLPTTGGPVALLTKPFRLSDLVETVSSLVERTRLG